MNIKAYLFNVDSSQNSGNPCVDRAIAAAEANLGGEAGARISSGVDTYPETVMEYSITIPQSPWHNQLDAARTFAVCCSETQVNSMDPAYTWPWMDSYPPSPQGTVLRTSPRPQVQLGPPTARCWPCGAVAKPRWPWPCDQSSNMRMPTCAGLEAAVTSPWFAGAVI